MYVPTLRGTWHRPRGLVQGPVRLSWRQLQDLHGLCEQTSWATVKQSGARPEEKGAAREPLSWGLRLEGALAPAGCTAERGKFCLEPAGPRAACFCAELGCQKLREGKPGISGRQLVGVRMPTAQERAPGENFKYSGMMVLQVRAKEACLFTCLGRGESLYLFFSPLHCLDGETKVWE